MNYALEQKKHWPELLLPGGTVRALIIAAGLSIVLGALGFASHPIIIAVLVIGVAGAIAVFSNPVFPLFLFFLLLYVRPGEIFPPLEALKLPKLVMFACILSTIIQYWIIRKEKLVKSPIDFWLNGFVIMMIVSFLGSFDFMYSFENFNERFSKVVMMIFVIKNIIDNKKKLVAFVWLFITLSFIISIMAARNKITGENLVEEIGRVQLTGILSDPNDLALAVVITIPFIYRFFFIYRNFFVRFYLLLVFGLGVYTIQVTYSRGGLLGFGIVTYLTLVLGRPRKTQIIVTLILVTLALGVLTTGVGVRQDDGAADSANSRFKLWEAGVRMAIVSPIWGQGLANYKFKSNYYSPSYGANKTAHSIFFLVLGEMGFVGFYFYLMLLYTELKMGWQLHRLARLYPSDSPLRGIGLSCFSSFVGFIVCGLTLSQSYTWFPFIIISLTIVANRILAWDLGYQKYYHVVQFIDAKVDEQVYA